jgi:Lecithin retinol acyltransferase
MNRKTDNARDTRRTAESFFSRDLLLDRGEEPPLASHLVTSRALYTHHGIYVGNGHVIHYSGLANGLRRGPVECISLERFARGRSIRVRCDSRCFSRCEVVKRARSRLGECRYHVLTNNCEHFCAWALRDEGRSAQVERLRATPQTLYNAICMQYARVDRRQHALVHVLRGWCNCSSLTRFGESATITLIRRVINECYRRSTEATYRIGMAE